MAVHLVRWNKINRVKFFVMAMAFQYMSLRALVTVDSFDWPFYITF